MSHLRHTHDLLRLLDLSTKGYEMIVNGNLFDWCRYLPLRAKTILVRQRNEANGDDSVGTFLTTFDFYRS